MLLQRVTSLRRCAQANAPAASYWLRRVLDDGGRRDWRPPLFSTGGTRPLLPHFFGLKFVQVSPLLQLVTY